ncbi:hypothetical protein LguiA_004709 [Lonicera macranthoides]
MGVNLDLGNLKFITGCNVPITYLKKCHENNGIEEGVCGYNPEHGERGGRQDYGVGEENT